MRDVFQLLAMRFCLVGLGVTVLAWLVHLLLSPVVRRIGESVRAVGRKSLIPLGFLSLFVGVLVVCGSTKEDPGTNAPPPRVETVLEVPAHVGTNAFVRVEKWWLRGAWEDGETVAFPEGWCFPYGSNHLTRVEIWSQGGVYASGKDAVPIVGLSVPLALEPFRTQVVHGPTTNNGYRIAWQDAHPGRDGGVLVDASLELRRNGDMVVTEGGVSTFVPYAVPFAHDGFGQDEAWVRANFPNAGEILAVGYTNWVDGRVGVGVTNGLYRFSAAFADAPPEPLRLTVGDYSVAVTNAGEYVFLLERNVDYSFDVWPRHRDVVYSFRGDMGDGAQVVSVRGDESRLPDSGVTDGGWSWLYPPDDEHPGRSIWLDPPSSDSEAPSGPDAPSEPTNQVCQVRLTLDIPRGIPHKGPAVAATYTFDSDVATNGWLVLECVSGTDRVSLWHDADTNAVFVCSNRIASATAYTTSFYVHGDRRSLVLEDVSWRLSFVPDEGDGESVLSTSTVFACYCQPVMEVTDSEGNGYFNPSYVKIGRTAWFRVDTFPPIHPNEITWDGWQGTIGFPDGRSGGRVKVLGETTGHVVIGVTLLDYTDDRMKFEFDVVE